jgi:integrase
MHPGWKELCELFGNKGSLYLPLGFDLLARVLASVQVKYSLTEFFEGQIPSLAVLAEISSQVQAEVERKCWRRRNTAHRVLSELRQVLARSRLHPTVLRSFCLADVAKLTPDQREWREVLRRTPAVQRLRRVLDFYIDVLLPKLQLRERWPEDVQAHVQRLVDQEPNLLQSFRTQQCRWIRLFFAQILNIPIPQPRIPEQPHPASDNNGDPHVFTKSELEALHKVARRDLQDEMLFITLVTTGMRVGGYARMRCNDLAIWNKCSWQPRDEGSTVEKAGKVFHFQIHWRLQVLFAQHLASCNQESVFLFPGHKPGECSETAPFQRRFKALCRKAGLRGRQCHIHSLRHCFARMLQGLGNSPDIISQLLNHADVLTTQRHYLRESSVQISDQLRFPWAPEPAPPPQSVPDFLSSPSASADELLSRLRAFNLSLA